MLLGLLCVATKRLVWGRSPKSPLGIGVGEVALAVLGQGGAVEWCRGTGTWGPPGGHPGLVMAPGEQGPGWSGLVWAKVCVGQGQAVVGVPGLSQGLCGHLRGTRQGHGLEGYPEAEHPRTGQVGAIWEASGVPGSPEATMGGCGEPGRPQAVTTSLRPAPWLSSTTNHFQSRRQICCF